MKPVCIHGHFYQPPREDPWTGEVPLQPSARPDRDWNQRAARECYLPNGAARVVDGRGREAGAVRNGGRARPAAGGRHRS